MSTIILHALGEYIYTNIYDPSSTLHAHSASGVADFWIQMVNDHSLYSVL